MKRTGSVLILLLILSFTMTGCKNDTSVKNINAEYFTISYGNSLYDGQDKCEPKTVDLLINDYNSLELAGTTNQDINLNKSICITFINKDKISGQVTVDDNGVCHIEDRANNYIVDTNSKLYKDAKKSI